MHIVKKPSTRNSSGERDLRRHCATTSDSEGERDGLDEAEGGREVNGGLGNGIMLASCRLDESSPSMPDFGPQTAAMPDRTPIRSTTLDMDQPTFIDTVRTFMRIDDDHRVAFGMFNDELLPQSVFVWTGATEGSNDGGMAGDSGEVAGVGDGVGVGEEGALMDERGAKRVGTQPTQLVSIKGEGEEGGADERKAALVRPARLPVRVDFALSDSCFTEADLRNAIKQPFLKPGEEMESAWAAIKDLAQRLPASFIPISCPIDEFGPRIGIIEERLTDLVRTAAANENQIRHSLERARDEANIWKSHVKSLELLIDEKKTDLCTLERNLKALSLHPLRHQ